jgi:hypothetical protein
MSDLPKKIQAATQGLREIQRDIQAPLPAAGPRLAEIDSAALKEFKVVVDYIRQLIWTYLQADSRESGLNLDAQVRSLRLQHVTEMLHTIQQEVQGRKLESNPATMSFLNAVQEIADAAFQRHSAESKIERAS